MGPEKRAKKLIQYRGLVCSARPAYVATQANDWTALERVAVAWREANGARNSNPKITGLWSDDG